MKRMISLALAVILALGLLAGCGAPAEGARLTVVTTCFALYDWTRNVVGDVPGAEVVWLMDSGVDPHSFQPSVEDLMRLSDCDLFVYVGGESDQWAADALSEAKNENLTALNLLQAMGGAALTEQAVPGAEPETEEAADAQEEHIWMSLKNAQICVQAIAEALAALDPDFENGYRENAAGYCEKLRALDESYTEALAQAQKRAILVADRFPFRYLAEDYDLDYYAAFSGCSAETEASFQTVTGLAKTADDLALPVILVTENGKRDIAETVVKNTETRPEIRVLDSLQSVTAEDTDTTYLSAMSDNLEVLKEALQCR